VKMFKRLTTTFSASFTNFVTRVEDQDAYVKQALQDARLAAGKAGVHLKKVSRDNDLLRKQLQQTNDDQQQWSVRALEVANQDEERALGCIKRKIQCEQKAIQLQKTLNSQLQLQARIQGNISQLEQRIETISRQRNVMRSRQSAADAMRVIKHIDEESPLDLEEVFENWEIRLSEDEFGFDNTDRPDVFEAAFVAEEESLQLRKELGVLVTQNGEGK
jgi:phage shock protein A